MRNIKKFLNNVYDDIFEGFTSMKLFALLESNKYSSTGKKSTTFFHMGTTGLLWIGITFYIIYFFGRFFEITQKLYNLIYHVQMYFKALWIIYFSSLSFEIAIRLTIHTFKYLCKFFESLKYWIPKSEFFTIGGYYHCIGLSEKLIYLLSYVIAIVTIPIILTGYITTLFLSLALGVLSLALMVYIFYYLPAKGIYRVLKYIYRLFL